MNVWTLLCLLITATSTAGNNIALFWNLYDAVISGGRILHDVADGVGAVSKAIRAIDSFLDASAEAQVTASLKKAEEEQKAEESTETPKQTPEDPSPNEPKNPVPTEEADGGGPVPSFSGCGALGFHIRDESLPMSRMTECCGTHDACYSASCRASKRDCDGKLRNCLFSTCDNKTVPDKSVQKTCKGAAKLLFSGTMALSFQQYNDAQSKLDCKNKQKWGKRR